MKKSRPSTTHAIGQPVTSLRRMCDELDRAQGRDTSPYQTLIDRILDEAEVFPAVRRVRPPSQASSANHRPSRKKRR